MPAKRDNPTEENIKMSPNTRLLFLIAGLPALLAGTCRGQGTRVGALPNLRHCPQSTMVVPFRPWPYPRPTATEEPPRPLRGIVRGMDALDGGNPSKSPDGFVPGRTIAASLGHC